MSENSPFNESIVDEDEISALQSALELAHGFKLFFVVCDDVWKLSERMDTLFHRMLFQSMKESQLSLEDNVLVLPPGIKSLYQLVEEQVQENKRPSPIFVYGVDDILGMEFLTGVKQFVPTLNSERNFFTAHISCPLIIGLSSHALRQIVVDAPDFFSIRSGIFYLTKKPNLELDWHWIVQDCARNDSSFEEKSQSLARINPLLEELSSLPPSQKNTANQMFLLNQKVNLLHSLGRYEEAEETVRLNLSLSLATSDVESRLISWINLILVLRHQNKKGELELARLQAQNLLEKVPKLKPAYYHGLGIELIEEQHYEGAFDALQKALNFLNRKNLDDIEREPGILINLGIASSHLNNIDIAQYYFTKALNLGVEQGSPSTQAHAWGNLAVTHSQVGRFVEAFEEYKSAALLLSQYGTQDSLLRILIGWATLNERMGHEENGQLLRDLASKAMDANFDQVKIELRDFVDGLAEQETTLD